MKILLNFVGEEMKCNTCNDKYFIISNDKNWNDEIQKCDECNYFKTDEQAKNYMESEVA